MKSPAIIISLIFNYCLQAQVSFKTIVPQQPVVEGESFRVQYVLTGAEPTSSIRTPVFTGFRLIGGPNIYDGSTLTTTGSQYVQNFVYTLEALRPGRFVIPPALISWNNKPLQSNEAMLRVISREEAARNALSKEEQPGADYFLKPGEDPYKKIKDNLFVKVQVDKQRCFAGEPVLAVFKLYSRLESKSDIIKNPGFYGFTVYDMVGLADKQAATENINGKLFDVHTIRKVQLYPLQPGRFTIDPMEVRNKVEFSRSAVNRKTEQKIAEGMMGIDTNEPVTEGTAVYEATMSTAPVEVDVKPLPEKPKPAQYSGAVGRFTFKSRLTKDSLAKNEQGFFEITIAGRGNFTQLDAPSIQWPEGVEGFEPSVIDELDKTKVPLTGERIFRYPVVCAAAGTYILPAISFSYFDKDSNSYKTLSTQKLPLTVINRERPPLPQEEHKISFAEQNERAARTAALIAAAAVLMILIYWIAGSKDKKKNTEPAVTQPVLPSVDALLQPALDIADENEFYKFLQSAIWQFAAQRFGLTGSDMTKQVLGRKMNDAIPDSSLAIQLIAILEKCEVGIFTRASLAENRELLLQQTREVLEKADEALL